MRRTHRFLTTVMLAFLGATPLAFASDSPCFSEKSCAAATLSGQSHNALENSCEVTRAAACADIKDPEKLYTCDVKSFCKRTSLDTAIAGIKGCGLGIWDGSLGPLWELLKGMAEFAAYSSGCNTDIEQKLDMIDRFNEALPPGESFKTPPEQSLQRMSCSDLLKEFNTKAYNVSQRMTQRSAADVSKEINPARKNYDNSKSAAERILDQFNVRRECYNTQALAEMYCEAGTMVALGAVGGYTTFRAWRAARLVELSRSVQVEAAYARFAKAGEAVMSTAGKLSNSERKGVAEVLLGRKLSKQEQDALIAAHKIGEEREAGFFTYTEQELRDKARLLRRAGFTLRERAILMRNGVAGSSADSSAIQASISQTKTFKMLPKHEQASRLKVFEMRDRFLRQVESNSYRYSTMSAAEKREYLRDVRGLAEATRVAGESAASVGDLASSQTLAKEALARFQRVLKDAPDMLNSPRERDLLFEMKVRAGDVEGAAKQFGENALKDFQADGFPNSNAAMNENYLRLKAEAETGPSRSVLNNERGTERSIATGRPIAATNASSAYLRQMNELKTLDKILESKPSWLVNADYARERSRIQSLLENVKRELKSRGYNPDQL